MYTLDNQYDGGSENVGKFIRRRQPDRNLLQEVVKKFEHIIYKSASVHDHVDSETRSFLDIKPFFVENILLSSDVDLDLMIANSYIIFYAAR